MAVKILTDSAADIEIEEAEKLGIYVEPIELRFKDEEYLDGVTLSHKDFFEKLIETDEIPKTSLISPGRFEETFSKLTENGDELVVITLSSKLSGTFNSAKDASKNFNNKVFVVDSLNASIGERILVEYAIRLSKEGKTASQIANELNEKKKKIKLMAVLGTLKYLRKGGRISPLIAFAGELMSLKPVIAVENGEIKLVGKALGSKKGNNLLNQLIEKCGGIDFSMPYGTMYSGIDDSYLQKYISDSKSIYENYTDTVPQYIIGCTIGSHIGPGAIGVSFFSK